MELVLFISAYQTHLHPEMSMKNGQIPPDSLTRPSYHNSDMPGVMSRYTTREILARAVYVLGL